MEEVIVKGLNDQLIIAPKEPAEAMPIALRREIFFCFIAFFFR
jgi:hypothetical protein